MIEAKRLILRTWQVKDAAAYYRINQDPKVIGFLREPITMEEVKDFIKYASSHWENIKI
ncbi:GNAT family N-acetyltransferase [Pajaroellobacter abortibovis]|uniref:GNAT family N-acetyltransferase n=1 Tax=Pajaroellobacter abortibovis TaxID=1882918 RepID=UPI001C12BD15